MDIKQKIIGVVSDAMADLLYYDRKEDENLPVGAIEAAISAGEITVEEIIAVVRKELESSVNDSEAAT